MKRCIYRLWLLTGYGEQEVVHPSLVTSGVLVLNQAGVDLKLRELRHREPAQQQHAKARRLDDDVGQVARRRVRIADMQISSGQGHRFVLDDGQRNVAIERGQDTESE